MSVPVRCCFQCRASEQLWYVFLADYFCCVMQDLFFFYCAPVALAELLRLAGEHGCRWPWVIGTVSVRVLGGAAMCEDYTFTTLATLSPTGCLP